jgi:lysophospholipid acyltransferase (LPLAT)-like uncharacterized protein
MRILPFFIFIVYKLLFFTWRITIDEHPDVRRLIDSKAPLILAHWHGDELALFHLVTKYGLATMTSTSKDGQLVDFLLRMLGGKTSRGSSTRGGVSALKGLIRLCRSGHIISIAVDGPRGPIYQPKPGVFELSKLCEARIVPVGVTVSSAFIFKKSWNKTYLPLPFAQIKIKLDEPKIFVDENTNPKDFELSKQLTLQLNAARQHSAKIIATV